MTTGSLYGLEAMGLVLTYKTLGIFNFAHGAIAAGAAYIFYELNTRNDVPWPIAGLIVILVVAPIAGILTERTAESGDDPIAGGELQVPGVDRRSGETPGGLVRR